MFASTLGDAADLVGVVGDAGDPLGQRGVSAFARSDRRAANDVRRWCTFRPAGHHEMAMNTMLDQLLSWSHAMKSTRDTDQMTAVRRVP
ncbi:hypothetical protein ACFQFC_35575 [Amorphoplanes digitatis]|uniref:Uncharacterized protein n=1 Tax=Actinoplanes digitatis TaxID=1868 RepID=A0A7W7MNX8_9ACTN|nr:hypothetical protein [Actinoplanes digitatis]MBB4761481.1 hypothetical protein [Actinoplanes digitatis]BFE69984.1 hypothetical protein GCM10020092_032850 [Actinoplanes digitatis]